MHIDNNLNCEKRIMGIMGIMGILGIMGIMGICSGEDSTFPATRLCATGGVAALSKGGRAADDTTHQE